MDEKQVTRAKARLFRGRTGRWMPAGGRIPARIIGLLLVVLLTGDSTFADFMVQPMLLRLTVQPGRQYTRELKLENSDPQSTETLMLRLAELTQKPDASWTEIRPDDPNLSKAVLRSCKGWLTVPSSDIKVPPYQVVPFTLRIDVPAGTRGFFFASIVATTAPRTVTLNNGVVTPMNVVMVVPVILEVQSTPMPRKVELADVGLDPQPQTEAAPAASNVTLDIANNGGTFSRVLPIVRLWGQSGGHWTKMLDLKFAEIAIMPGAKLHVKQDAGQPLASGAYRLEGFVFVDGQRVNEPAFTEGETMRSALHRLAHTVVRARPWFEPGPWGGSWILEKIPALAREVPNYAWSFELIAPENGIILTSDQRLLEVSFDCLMCGLCASRCPAEIVQYNVAILGRRLYSRHLARPRLFPGAPTAMLLAEHRAGTKNHARRLWAILMAELWAERWNVEP